MIVFCYLLADQRTHDSDSTWPLMTLALEESWELGSLQLGFQSLQGLITSQKLQSQKTNNYLLEKLSPSSQIIKDSTLMSFRGLTNLHKHPYFPRIQIVLEMLCVITQCHCHLPAGSTALHIFFVLFFALDTIQIRYLYELLSKWVRAAEIVRYKQPPKIKCHNLFFTFEGYSQYASYHYIRRNFKSPDI